MFLCLENNSSSCAKSSKIYVGVTWRVCVRVRANLALAHFFRTMIFGHNRSWSNNWQTFTVQLHALIVIDWLKFVFPFYLRKNFGLSWSAFGFLMKCTDQKNSILCKRWRFIFLPVVVGTLQLIIQFVYTCEIDWPTK